MASDAEILRSYYESVAGVNTPVSTEQKSQVIGTGDGRVKRFVGVLSTNGFPIVRRSVLLATGVLDPVLQTVTATEVLTDNPDSLSSLTAKFVALGGGEPIGEINYLNGAIVAEFTGPPAAGSVIQVTYSLAKQTVNSGLASIAESNLNRVNDTINQLNNLKQALRSQVLDVITGTGNGSIYQRLVKIRDAFYPDGIISTPFGSTGSETRTTSNWVSVSNELALNGGVEWVNPSNAEVTDNQFATCVVLSEQRSGYLRGSNFGFNVPTTATVTGVEVTVKRKKSGFGAVKDIQLAISTNPHQPEGYIVPPVNVWPVGDSVVTYGSDQDTWGLDLSPFDLNSTNFSFFLAILEVLGPDPGIEVTASVDSILVTAHYRDTDITDFYILEDGTNEILYQYPRTKYGAPTNAIGWSNHPDNGVLDQLLGPGNLDQLVTDYEIVHDLIHHDLRSGTGSYGIMATIDALKTSKKILEKDSTLYGKITTVLARYVTV